MPQTKIYSLALKDVGSVANVKTDASVDIVVRSPRYLAQPYIAYRTSPYQLQISRYSKWDYAPAEMMAELFRKALSEAELFRQVKVSNFVPPEFHCLEIDLKRFERSDDGSNSFAELSYDIELRSPGGKAVFHGSFHREIRLGGRGFSFLAEALSNALSEGISEAKTAIAGAVQGGM